MQPNESTRPTNVRWLICGLACAASWMLYLHRYAWGLMKKEFKEEFPEFSDFELGWLDSAFLMTYGIGQIPGGMAGDRFGPRVMLSVLTLLGSIAAVGVAWTSGFWAIIGARGIFGLAQAGVYPVLSKMTRTWFPLASRTTVQGAVTAMGRLGAAFAPLIIASLLMGLLGLSWRTALFILTAPGVMLAVGFWLAVRDSPRAHPLTNEAERELLDPAPSPPAPLPEGEGRNAIREGEPPIRALPEAPPPLVITGATMVSMGMLFAYTFLSTFQDQFYVNWLPLFLREGKELDNETMGLFAPLPFVGGAIGGVLGGVLNDLLIQKLGSRRWARSLVAFTGKFVAAALVLASMTVDDGRWTMAVLLGARIFSDWSLPTQWAAVTDMGGRAGATLFGIVNTVGIAGGVVAGPALGYIKQEYGWDGQFYTVALMCALAAVVWLFIDCTKRVVRD